MQRKLICGSDMTCAEIGYHFSFKVLLNYTIDEEVHWVSQHTCIHERSIL